MTDNTATNSTTSTASAGGNTPWGWLGLLKWSLAYSDGTSPTKASPMSAEDRAFLEKVMKEGIIDENERMKEILQLVTQGLEDIQQQQQQKHEENRREELQGEIQDLLQELRDIVEQIDYARAFAAMKGLPFLLGCIAQKEVPRPIQTSCLGVLATMASNNEPIQKELLEMGAIKTLSEIFQETINEPDFRAKIIQALSATVRSYELSENVFCGVEQAPDLVWEGLQLGSGRDVLQKRTLFFLRALITSDDSTRERVHLFDASIAFVADHLIIVPTTDEDTPGKAEIREMGLAFLLQILEQKKSVNTILNRKESLVALGVQRIQALRAMTGDEKEYAAVELETWEALLVQLARASPDAAEEPRLMIAASNPEVEPQ
jgi:hsp70-interacting protein